MLQAIKPEQEVYVMGNDQNQEVSIEELIRLAIDQLQFSYTPYLSLIHISEPTRPY